MKAHAPTKRRLTIALLAAMSACTAGERADPPPFASSRIAPEEPFLNWGAHPKEIEERLSAQPFEIVKIEEAGSGVTGANRATLAFADGKKLEVKWKSFPPELDHWNNSPRKEIAAYHIQKWFLSPEQYVVPTSVVRCVDLDVVRKWRPDIKPTVEGTQCVLVVVTVWLDHVVAPEDIYDAERFQRDRAYAVHIANLNVLTFLIDHRDGRQGNFLLADEAKPARAYAADNGISFDPWVWNFFVANWNELRVPALPKTAIDRLEKVKSRDFEKLRVLAELKLDERGIYRPVDDPGPAIDFDVGARRRDDTLQLGLTGEEIAATRKRLAQLLTVVKQNEVPEF